MPKGTQFTHEDRLKNIPLPTHGGRYAVVSHQFIIDATKAELLKSGYEIKTALYKSNNNGEVAQGVYELTYGNDPDMSLMFAWVNSYDKSLRFRCAIGAIVNESNNMIVAGDMANYGRKHMGDAKEQVKDHIESQIALAVSYYSALVHDKKNMKNVIVTDEKRYEYFGLLALKGFLTVNQLTVMKEEIKDSDFTYSDNKHDLWNLYNHALYSIRTSHPRNWMDQQKDLHKITRKMFLKNAVSYNPNQITLDQAINEATVVPSIPADELDLQDLQDVQHELDKGIKDLVDDDWSIDKAKEVEFPQQIEATEEEANELLHGVDNTGGLENAADEEADMIKNEEIIDEKEEEDENLDLFVKQFCDEVSSELDESRCKLIPADLYDEDNPEYEDWVYEATGIVTNEETVVLIHKSVNLTGLDDEVSGIVDSAGNLIELIDPKEEEDVFNAIADVIKPETSEVNELDDFTTEEQVEEQPEQLNLDDFLEDEPVNETVAEEDDEKDKSNDELLELPDFDF